MPQEKQDFIKYIIVVTGASLLIGKLIAETEHELEICDLCMSGYYGATFSPAYLPIGAADLNELSRDRNIMRKAALIQYSLLPVDSNHPIVTDYVKYLAEA